MSRHPSPSDEMRGWLLGALGVLIFAMTLPMTRLAVGSLEAPQWPPLFVTAGRAAGAAWLASVYLIVARAARPRRAQWPALALSAAGTVVGFPLCLGLALREVPAMHAAVVTGVLPLFTAIAGAVHLRQRPSAGFWVCAVVGCGLVLGYAAWEGGGQLVPADALLLLAMGCASVGYVAGSELGRVWPAPQVISWVLVVSVPVTWPVALWTWPGAEVAGRVSAAAWTGLAYVTVFSMWLGFFAWYRGLALGGVVRVSQVQMVQPFLSLLLAVPVVNEPLRGTTLVVAALVVVVVAVGRRQAVGQARRSVAVARSARSPS